MKWEDYHLDAEISKTTVKITLWKNEKGIVDIANGTLAIKVLLDNKPCGYIFHGKGTLLLDTIIETEKGAIGRSIEKPLDKAFLMFGSLEETQHQFTNAGNEDLSIGDYEDQQQFMQAAQSLLDEFFDRSTNRLEHSKTLNNNGVLVFAFPNEVDKMDILVVKDSKLVYTSNDKVYVLKGERAVLTSDEGVVVTNHGKSIIINKDCCLGTHLHKDSHKDFP
jgi:hypothetical protein